ncbi:MAG: DeoR/GlpR family DNA-binding transcription regulator [Clostridiales bacterium]|nr:DeoR/GlpR family DNA-binding transcription regulator [Clostridiales bacterium]
MYKSERQDKIYSILEKKGYMSLDELCEALFCSRSTLRRDLIEMEDMGVIIRNRGGVYFSKARNKEYSSLYRNMANFEGKRFIARLSANLVQDNMTIFMDSSSTVLSLCEFLKSKNNITILTNGISTAANLIENNCCEKTMIAGGFIKKGSTSVIGEDASRYFEQFKADISFISCMGIDEEGLYEASQHQAQVKRCMMKNSKYTVLMCDSTKFGKSYFYKLARYNNISMIVTDREPIGKLKESILNNSCGVVFSE